MRFALTSEAGLNDGLAFPFVYLALLVAAGGATAAGLAGWAAWDLLGRSVDRRPGRSRHRLGAGQGGVPGPPTLAAPGRGRGAAAGRRGDPARLRAGRAGQRVRFPRRVLLRGWRCARWNVATATTRPCTPSSSGWSGCSPWSCCCCSGWPWRSGLLSGLTWGGALIGDPAGVRDPAGHRVAGAAPEHARRPAADPGRLRPRERIVTAFYGIRGVGSLYYLSYGLTTATASATSARCGRSSGSPSCSRWSCTHHRDPGHALAGRRAVPGGGRAAGPGLTGTAAGQTLSR